MSEGNGSDGSPATPVSAMDGAHPIHPERGAAHTPGPWLAVTSDANTVVSIFGKGRPTRIAEVHSYTPGFGPARPERDANAKLIAAAPDLLSALRLMLADFEDYPASERPCHAFDVARAAIAKALDDGASIASTTEQDEVQQSGGMNQ